MAEDLAEIPPGEGRFLLATGRRAGESFDDARLDMFFLPMPISWKGPLVQHAGRLHRQDAGKTEVRIHDDADREEDAGVPGDGVCGNAGSVNGGLPARFARGRGRCHHQRAEGGQDRGPRRGERQRSQRPRAHPRSGQRVRNAGHPSDRPTDRLAFGLFR